MEVYLNKNYGVVYKIFENHIECFSLNITNGRFLLTSTSDIIYCLEEKILLDLSGNSLLKITLKEFVRKMK